MADITELSASVASQRSDFLAAMAKIRPQLHRYCSKMTGSVLDGEDVVQDALSHAFYRLPSLTDPSRLHAWLFRIAHNKAIDHLRRRQGEAVSWDDVDDVAAPPEVDRTEVEDALTRVVTHLPPKERACVVLKDVLDYPLQDIAEIVGSTLGAVKAALHRGRRKLADKKPTDGRGPSSAEARLIAAYVDRFNGRDWDGVKSLLRADARLEVVDHALVVGRDAISKGYFYNYAGLEWRWRLGLARVDGQVMLVHWRNDDGRWCPHAPVLLGVADGQVITIKDFVHVEYLLDHADVEVIDEGE